MVPGRHPIESNATGFVKASKMGEECELLSYVGMVEEPAYFSVWSQWRLCFTAVYTGYKGAALADLLSTSMKFERVVYALFFVNTF